MLDCCCTGSRGEILEAAQNCEREAAFVGGKAGKANFTSHFGRPLNCPGRCCPKTNRPQTILFSSYKLKSGEEKVQGGKLVARWSMVS